MSFINAGFAISANLLLLGAVLNGLDENLNRKSIFASFSLLIALWVVLALVYWPLKTSESKSEEESVPLLPEVKGEEKESIEKEQSERESRRREGGNKPEEQESFPVALENSIDHKHTLSFVQTLKRTDYFLALVFQAFSIFFLQAKASLFFYPHFNSQFSSFTLELPLITSRILEMKASSPIFSPSFSLSGKIQLFSHDSF